MVYFFPSEAGVFIHFASIVISLAISTTNFLYLPFSTIIIAMSPVKSKLTSINADLQI